MDNYVILKGKEDRLVIHLDAEIDYETLKKNLEEKLREAEKFLKNAKVAIEFSNRSLSEHEENQLVEIIRRESDIQITYIMSNGKSFIGNFIIPETIIDEGVTKFYKGNLRSGQSVHYEGNLVVLGDINPGAIVTAKGNIVVLGYLNGTAYAGIEDEDEAFISALKMNPIQLRIGKNIARNPAEDMLVTNRVKKEGSLEVAYIKDGKMHIEDFNKITLRDIMKI
ncbi:septum site-determining protein MinC [Ilyobacter polytropus]|uniref:Probable septum site-determining protein MinC n=1 Tax=Ilyobacter polytropus (strain ATCC 51220 / DSM 2926 / LMG 16218 / CuHBu1) TaxID=572544 RepID=E3H8I8_ILYPC|nr:septum site-determining protein MinC [Ilyobacter polytropus]ADO82970.1 septum site-determining protein MinC [Ilyobacter polytropus DSM 2926]